MVSGDSFLVTRPEAILPEPVPRSSVRLNFRTESRRAPGGGRSPTRFNEGRELEARSRSRQARFSPYPGPAVKLDLLRSVLQQRLVALGGVIVAQFLLQGSYLKSRQDYCGSLGFHIAGATGKLLSFVLLDDKEEHLRRQ
ncbi:hypothetical protein AB1E18_011568 [Capra hircus]